MYWRLNDLLADGMKDDTFYCHPGDAGGGEAGDGRCLWNCLELRIVKMQLIFCRKNQEWGCRYRFKWLEMKRLACHKHQEDLFGKVENFL